MHVPDPLAVATRRRRARAARPARPRRRRPGARGPSAAASAAVRSASDSHVAPNLDDQLARVGMGAGVMGHLPSHHRRPRRRERRSGRPPPRRRCSSRTDMELRPPRGLRVGYPRSPGARGSRPARLTVSGAEPTIRISQLLRTPAPAPESPEVVIDAGPAAVLDGLKARLEQLLRDGARQRPARVRRRPARGAARGALRRRRACVEALAATERELAAERKQLEDAERRGRLAAAVPDPETVAVAERFAARHRERVAVLERKIVVQRDELVAGRARAGQEMTRGVPQRVDGRAVPSAVDRRRVARPGIGRRDAGPDDERAHRRPTPTGSGARARSRPSSPTSSRSWGSNEQ